jgi:hypothetical protein
MALMQLVTPSLTRSTTLGEPARGCLRHWKTLVLAPGRQALTAMPEPTKGYKGWPDASADLVAWPSPVPGVLVTGLHETLYRGLAQLALPRARAPRTTKVIHE